jgi:hypothetical protein
MPKYLLVVEEFDPDKSYPIKIRPQYARILSSFQKGQKINPKEYINDNQSLFTKKGTQKAVAGAIYHALTLGRKIAVLRDLTDAEAGAPISFDDFCRLETVQYFINQHKGSRYRNLNPKYQTGTAFRYSDNLWKFNNWLAGRDFEYFGYVSTGGDSFRRVKTKVKLESVEHFLKLYQESFHAEKDFVKLIKMYLMDSQNASKRSNTVKLIYNSIKSYFEKNDTPLNFRFDYNARHKSIGADDEQSSLSLDEVIELLSVGKPNLTQKAVFLCKFHRGLDTSTLVDRFNFEVWPQLVEYFRTEDYTIWDLKKCPVPIKLVRIKTDYLHLGFLDVDAIVAIQKYLPFRKKLTGKEMQNGDALFLNTHKEPIEKGWITYTLRKLCKNAGLNRTLPGYNHNCRYQINSHEFRDLLKSTLLACDVRPDVADHVIGHKPKDSYEKQAILYPENVREEFSKASNKLNLFSNISSYVTKFEDIEELKFLVKNLREENEKFKFEILRRFSNQIMR